MMVAFGVRFGVFFYCVCLLVEDCHGLLWNSVGFRCVLDYGFKEVPFSRRMG